MVTQHLLFWDVDNEDLPKSVSEESIIEMINCLPWSEVAGSALRNMLKDLLDSNNDLLWTGIIY